jgi:multimeric flavodoxin WrbA
LRNKTGGVIVVARRAGTAPAFGLFLDFFNIHRMVSLGGAIAYGHAKGSVKHDSRGMAEAKALGRNMAKTLLKYRQGGLL